MFLNKRKGGQTWSFDLLIAVVIFIVIVGVFYAFLSSDKTKGNPEALQEEARTISRLLNCDASPSDFCILQNGEIIPQRLQALSEMTEEELTIRGLTGVFCIYLEDKDGNLVPINDTKAGIGDDDFVLATGIRCTQNIN